MNWLSRPKVLLALLVNAAYVLFCLTAPAPRPVAGSYGLGSVGEVYRAPAKRAPVHVPLAPPSGPSNATTYYAKETDQLNIYLTDDLTLVRRPGHRLLLSPIFTVRRNDTEPPRSVLLRFVSFSGVQFYDDESRLALYADGELKWSDGPRFAGFASPNTWARHSVTTGEGGEVVETVGEELPYEDFLEIISARRVIITLGPDSVELTADQIEALRSMHRRLEQNRPEQPSPLHN